MVRMLPKRLKNTICQFNVFVGSLRFTSRHLAPLRLAFTIPIPWAKLSRHRQCLHAGIGNQVYHIQTVFHKSFDGDFIAQFSIAMAVVMCREYTALCAKFARLHCAI